MADLQKCRLFLLDMDGTIYLDNRLFDGTVEFLDYIKGLGGRYIFLTNNSSKSVDRYIEKLNGMGISAQRDDFLTSTDITIEVLKKRGFKKIYALGTESFKEQLRGAGLNTTDAPSAGIDCLCMGYDTELTYKKLVDACVLLKNGIAYIATNPDWVCPTDYGFVPDCGSVSEMLFAMALSAMKLTGFGKDETAIVGDRIYTDIACGVNAGINTVFVLSGEGVMADIEKYGIRPDFIFENVKEIFNKLNPKG